MPVLLNTLKKIFFWNYARNTWQWDVLCAVILVFIFLTPNRWFAGGERRVLSEHQTQMTVLLGPEVIANEADKRQIADRIKAVTCRDEFEVVAVRKMVAPDGTPRGFEVDIR